MPTSLDIPDMSTGPTPDRPTGSAGNGTPAAEVPGGTDAPSEPTSPAVPLPAAFELAYGAILRTAAPASIGTRAANDQTPLDAFVSDLLTEARHSTVPALLVAGLLGGTIPTSGKLDDLAAFAKAQHAYYRDVLKSGFAELGPYEALGRGFAATDGFQDRYAAGTSDGFVSKAYADVFGRGPSAAQKDALLAQVSYFSEIYRKAGIAPGQAETEARGAVYGQIAGHAALSAAEPYLARAEDILTGFAKGGTDAYGTAFAA